MGKKIITLIALGAALQSVAQKDTLSGKALEDVMVTTATKVAQKQSSTGKVITVIGKEVIEKSSGKSVAQVLNEQAGITINGAYNAMGAVQTVFMRGSNVGRTLILLDGIPMNDPSTITTDFDLNMFSINDVERIEVCRGAQSTLYGSDAIAGVINIITLKKDITKVVNVKATITGGNLGTFKTNLQVFGKVNKLTYTTRFSKLMTKGFSSAYDSIGKKNFDNDGYNGDVLQTAVQYQVNNDLMVKTFVLNSQYKADIDAGKAYAQKRPKMNFIEMGIPVGSELVFNNNGEIATVVSEKSVRFRDEETSLTNATRLALGEGYAYHVAPGPYWRYNGRKLRDIYNETYQRLD